MPKPRGEINALFDALNEKPVAYQRIYAKITGSITGGLLLSQLVYWAKTVNWEEFYKIDREISEELGMGFYELRSAKNNLKRLKIVSIKCKGIPPKTYYTISKQEIINLITTNATKNAKKVNKNATLHSVEKPHYEVGKNHIIECGKTTSRGVEKPQYITENKTENKTDIYDTHIFSEKLKKSEEIKKQKLNKKKIKSIIAYYQEIIAKQTTSGNIIISQKVENNIQAKMIVFKPINLILAIKGFSEDEWQMRNNGYRGIEWFFNDFDRVSQNIGRFFQNNSNNREFIEKAKTLFN